MDPGLALRARRDDSRDPGISVARPLIR